MILTRSLKRLTKIRIMTENVSVGIVLQESFPIGMAATNRVLSYAVELAKEHSVKVYIPLPSEYGREVINKSPFGKFKGVQFEYVCKKTIWPINAKKIVKFYLVLQSIIRLLYVIKKDKPKVIIFYCNRGLISSFQIILTRLFTNHKIIIEETEFPKINKKNTSSLSIKINLWVYSIVDGMIVMTDELNIYYKSLKVKNILVLPMTVDFDRFINTQKSLNNKEKYFAYVGGNGGFKRDGLLDSVKAFKALHLKYYKFKYYIIGPFDKSNRIYLELEEYILNNSLNNSVLFLGVKRTTEIPSFLQNATGLIMTPPKDFVSGGFPTKLGEYLASGTPVITTKVSEISNYLNSDNAFLVEPCNIDEIFSKMVSIVEDPNSAKSIGANGKIIAESIFGAKKYIKEIEYFIF